MMKISFDKILLYLIPYLLIISLCYNNGYWSLFNLNIFQYYQVQDILKAISMPAFRFIGLTTLPVMIIAASMLSWSEAPIIIDKDKLKKWQRPKRPLDKPAETPKWQRLIAAITLLAFIACILIIAVSGTIVYLSPYYDESYFIDGYIGTLEEISIARVISMCFIIPFAIGIIYDIMIEDRSYNDIRIMMTMMSVFVTFAIAYHFGRLDAYKIILGTDFEYWVNKKGKPYKMLGKVDKFYFFSNDDSYVRFEDMNSRLFDSIYYYNSVIILSDDSLKAIELGMYGPRTIEKGEFFSQVYKPRKLKK